jgi:molybdopterin-guanine dinucleotide biosynthesis protein A
LVGGIVLTGGGSRRLGTDKATLTLPDGETLAARCVRLLQVVCDAVIEVGPGVAGIESVREDPPGGGPVAGLLAGVAVVGAPVVLLACDHPRMTTAVLERLARHDGDSLVPVIDDRPQFVAARYGPRAIHALRSSFAAGDRSFRSLDLVALDAEGADFDPEAFFDLDTPDDLVALRDDAPPR